MTPLSDHLYAILHNNALSYDDHARLDGIGQAVSAPSLTARTVWGWRVAVDSQFVRITANTKVVATRAAALNDAEDLFGQLAALVAVVSHGSVGAQNVYDRVNDAVVGWVGSVSIKARWSRSADTANAEHSSM